MTQSNRNAGAVNARPKPGSKPASKSQGELPGWTNGLRQLYDQVVDEDLPDSFRDLLARLDDKN